MELLWVSGETWCWEVCTAYLGPQLLSGDRLREGRCWDMGDGGCTVSVSPEKTWDLWVGEARAAWPQLTKALPGP